MLIIIPVKCVLVVQKGDIIYVLDVMSDSGLCHGVLKNHIGVFRLCDVETLPDGDGTLLLATWRHCLMVTARC